MPTYTWDTPKAFPALPQGHLLNDRGFTVAANQDGHLEVFAVGGDYAVWHIWQPGPNSTSWSDWASLGPLPDNAGFDFGEGPADPIAVQNQDGRLELFTLDVVQNVWHIWQAAPNANWGDWSPLGQPISAGQPVNSNLLRVFRDSGGCLQAVVQSATTGELFSRGQTAPNGNWANEWVSLGAPPASPSAWVVTGLGRSFFDRVYLTSGNIPSQSPLPIYVSQKSAFVAGAESWSGWKPSTLTLPDGVPAIYLAFASTNEDKRIEMFAIDNALHELWHTWQDNEDNWTGYWDNLGRPAGTPGNQDRTWTFVDVALDQLNRITVVRWQYNSDGFIYTIGQTSASNGWGTWTRVNSFPSNEFSPLAVMLRRQANGLLMIIGRGLGAGPGTDDDQIFYIPQLRT